MRLEIAVPQCKLSNCREPALPTGKRYCAQHRAEYDAKQRKYAEIQKTLPYCASRTSPECTGKLSLTRAEAGDDTCLQCQIADEQLAQEQNAVHDKIMSLESAESIDDLKAWLREHVLDI